MADLAKELEEALKDYLIKNIVLTTVGIDYKILPFSAFLIKFGIVDKDRVSAEFTYRIRRSSFRVHNKATKQNAIVMKGQSATVIVNVDVVE